MPLNHVFILVKQKVFGQTVKKSVWCSQPAKKGFKKNMIQKHLLQLCSWTFLLLCFQRASVQFCAVNIGSCCVRCVEAKRGRFAVANVKKNSGCSGKSPGGVTRLPSNRALLVEHNGIQKLKRLQ